jgi:hypothetical protein
MTAEAAIAVELFYSYAHEDEELRNQLDKHLRLLQRQGFLSAWYDRDIRAGGDWSNEIDAHLESAQIILLLISPDFLASDYCYDTEMKRSLERHQRGEARVIPIILRPCDWRTSPFAHLQCLPRDGKPVIEWDKQDAAFLDITRGLRRALVQRTSSVRQTPPLSSVAQQNRQRLLKRVRQTWIEGVLEQSLHQAALIALDLQEQPDALANPWQLEVQETSRPAHLLPAGTSIVQVYDHADGEMLLLGEPGAGKTTLLLELTRTLLERAEAEEQERMPIVFNLSSWAIKRQPLTNWLVEELWTKYQVPHEVGQAWIHADRVVALLDGLDEVAKDARQQCVQVINTYYQRRLQGQGTAPLVVCCRSEEYMTLPTRVALQQAVTIQPLTGEQIEHYLQSTYGQLDGLRVALRQDPELYKLAQQPLMLSIFTLAYQGAAPEDIPAEGTREDLQRQVFATYVKRMLKHRGVSRRFSRENLLRQLTFVATRMQQHQQTVLYLENLQAGWLMRRSRRLLYRLTVGPVAGLVAALVFSLTYILVSTRFYSYSIFLPFGLADGLFLGVPFGLLVGLVYGLGQIQPRESFTWSWRWTRQNISIGVVVGLLFGLVSWLLSGLSYSSHGDNRPGSFSYQLSFPIDGIRPGLLIVLLATLLAGLAFGFYTNKLDNRTRLTPNQGMWRSARNGLLFALVIGLLVGLSSVLLYALFNIWANTFLLVVYYGLIAGLLAGLGFGLGAFLQHFALRFWLWCLGDLPWSLVPFLDEAAHRLLLRKVGGGYVFIHRLLLDYFASLEKKKS